jgi:invasion protein IalB
MMFNGKSAILAAAVAFFAVPAAAQTATPIEQFRDWGTFKAETSNGPVCYALSQPTAMEPQGVNRGDVFFFVTTRPNQDVREEVSIIIGYPYREGSTAAVEVGSDSFTLMTRDDGAWVENPAEEERLVGAMRAGSTMTVRGTSQRGTDTVDRYSLMGISAALDRVSRECP